MKDSKTLLLYMVPYLTFCGALYHFTFWETFDINGLAFISLSDVLKSAVYPIFSILLSVVYNLTIQNLILPSSADGSLKPLIKRKLGNMTLLWIYLAISTAGSLVFFFTKTLYDSSRYIFMGGITAIAGSIALVNGGFLLEQFTSERMRRLVIDLIVFIPVVSYFTGKYRSDQIYQNLNYKYSLAPKATATPASFDTLKFIGNTEKHFVFTDLKNSKIVFVKSEKIDTLTLFDHK